MAGRFGGPSHAPAATVPIRPHCSFCRPPRIGCSPGSPGAAFCILHPASNCVKIVKLGGKLQWLNQNQDSFYSPCPFWHLLLLFLPCRRPTRRRLHRQAITIRGTISAFLAVLRFFSFIRAASPGFTNSIRARFSACGSPRIFGNTSDSRKESPSPRTVWNCSRT